MDWPKAKTILIFGFLLLDLYLAYLLFLAPGTQALPTALDSSALRKLRELTIHYNHNLQSTPVPMNTKPLPNVEIRTKLYSEQEQAKIVLTWLGEDVEGEGLANGSNAYSVNDCFLYLSQDGNLRYEDRTMVSGAVDTDRQHVLELLTSFLKERLDPDLLDAYQPSLAMEQRDGTWLVELNRHLFGTPLFADRIRSVVAGGRVRTVETRLGLSTKVSWLAQRSALVTADRALLRYLAQQAKPGENSVDIIDVRLGYDFANADRQELIPVWRVITSGDSKDFIVPAGVRYWRSGGP